MPQGKGTRSHLLLPRASRPGPRLVLSKLTKRAHGLASSAALHPGVLIVVQRFRTERHDRSLVRLTPEDFSGNRLPI